MCQFVCAIFVRAEGKCHGNVSTDPECEKRAIVAGFTFVCVDRTRPSNFIQATCKCIDSKFFINCYGMKSLRS